MSLAQRFMLALLAGTLATLGIDVSISVRTEMRRFEREIAFHQAIIGRAVRQATVQAWNEGGRQPALDRITDADQRYDDLSIRWVMLDGTADPLLAAEAPADVLGAPRHGAEVTWRKEGSNGGRLFTYVPVSIPGEPQTAIEVSQSLAREAELRSGAFIQALFVAVVLAIITALIAAGLGALLVSNPMKRLLEQAARIGRGDLSYRIEVAGRHELGLLASEMNRMCDSLAEARAQASIEAEAKLLAIEHLRHAERLATVGRLAAGMAHELGTPLNVALARAKPLTRADKPPAVVQAHAQIIVEQLERTARLMRRVLDFARRGSLQRVRIDVRTVVEHVVSLLTPLAKKGGVTFAVTQPEQPLMARVDAGQMEQVLTNIVMNAVQASRAGQTVSLSLRRERMARPDGHFGARPSAESPDGHRFGGSIEDCVLVEVADAGSGIDPADLNRIFEPFYTTKEVGVGTGLGLSIAYGIVDEHRGWISVESAPRRGSVFTVHVPLEEV